MSRSGKSKWEGRHSHGPRNNAQGKHEGRRADRPGKSQVTIGNANPQLGAVAKVLHRAEAQARHQEDVGIPRVEGRFYTGRWFSIATVLAIRHADDSITIGTCVIPRDKEVRDDAEHGGRARLKLWPKFLSEKGDRYEIIKVLRVAHNARVLFSRAAVQPDGTVGSFGRVTNVFPPVKSCPNANWLKELSDFTGLEFGIDTMVKFTMYRSLPIGIFQDTLGSVNALNFEREEIREHLSPEEVNQLEDVLDHVVQASGFALGPYLQPAMVDMEIQAAAAAQGLMVTDAELGGESHTPSFVEAMAIDHPSAFRRNCAPEPAMADAEPPAAAEEPAQPEPAMEPEDVEAEYATAF